MEYNQRQKLFLFFYANILTFSKQRDIIKEPKIKATEGEKMTNNANIIVTWKRTTTTGGEEWNYFYCDTMEEAEQFREDCEAVNGSKIVSIEEFNR